MLFGFTAGSSLVNEVHVIHKDEFKKIADSFSGFLELLEGDAGELLF